MMLSNSWLLNLLLLGISLAQNVTESVDEYGDLFQMEIPRDGSHAVQIRGELPAATPLPQGGIAATIAPNQTHHYSLNFSTVLVNISLSLSECARLPLTEDPLTLSSGIFEGTTRDGGLLQVRNFTGFNDSIVIRSPMTSDAQAQWSYQLGYDEAAAYSNFHEGLYWVDSDFANSLFVTEVYENFTQYLVDTPFTNFVNTSNYNETTDQFRLFLHNVNSSDSLQVNSSSKGESNGNFFDLGPYAALGKSYCAMQSSALLNQNNADFSTTTRSNNVSANLSRGQFLFTGLNSSNSYQMQLAIPPKPGYTGGMIFSPVPFHTKQSQSCQLIFNMTYCPNTAFSVPGNASVYSVVELTKLYDEYVGGYYNNFTHALSQVNCDANREDRFSVFSTCEDCNKAYRDWLCTVAVPRCQDWSNTAPYLKERLPGESRNQMINDVLRPGKYKEVLPCYWLCDNLAAYCPLSMGFSCPSGYMLNDSYGWQSGDGDVSCSYPGAVYKPDGAAFYSPSWALFMFTTTALCSLLI